MPLLRSGEAGLRAGEMMALERKDLDFVKSQVCVERSDWKGQVSSPKGGRLRYVPMTRRLGAALCVTIGISEAHECCPRTRRWASVDPEGAAVSCAAAARRAGPTHEGVHVLRRTFCSHLAMRGAPARAIQELAGHKDLATTQRYMHLSPAATLGGYLKTGH